MEVKRAKTGGRQKGTKNKTALRDLVTVFIRKNLKKLQADFDKLDSFERVRMFEKLLKYALPTLSSVSLAEDLERELKKLDVDQLHQLMRKVIDELPAKEKKIA